MPQSAQSDDLLPDSTDDSFFSDEDPYEFSEAPSDVEMEESPHKEEQAGVLERYPSPFLPVQQHSFSREVSALSMNLGFKYAVHPSRSLLEEYIVPAMRCLAPVVGTMDLAFAQLAATSFMATSAFEFVEFPHEVVEQRCPVCWDDDPASLLTLPCGHVVCKDCLRGYVKSHTSTREYRGLQCPFNVRTADDKEAPCPAYLPPSTVQNNLTPELREQYELLLINDIVIKCKLVHQCPAADCTFLSTTKSLMHTDVQCVCGYMYCTACKSQAHMPCSCTQVAEWERLNNDEQPTIIWMEEHSKKCPKCQTRTEKNHGCNHMTCRQCKHEYCWICMGAWESHRDYYHCSRPAAKEEPVAKGNFDSAHYTECWNLFNVNVNSLKLEDQLHAKLVSVCEDLAATRMESHGSGNVGFYRTAIVLLKTVRIYLKWTYPFMFFLKRDDPTGNQYQIFQSLQKRFEVAVEDLSHSIDRPVEEIDEVDVVKQTTVTTHTLQSILSFFDE
ncbi:IBR domain [Carpediemonas membranifera]|uniref:RBR-type E3 ubiquitin transferase n=1 Tax=Carpediemonas membranifera TaxID=201153 RepID=A0A8J6AQ48_9EUKA|nr:IBR domain [Carpediemonas membranifera]|eukprot:KAG9390523.1 IBR domain [Carpediemonas membranifera]